LIVDRNVASCNDLDVATIDGPYYRLTGFSPAPEGLSVWIALPGRVVSKKIRGGRISLRLGERYPNVAPSAAQKGAARSGGFWNFIMSSPTPTVARWAGIS
jgi:hypothetical protein